MRTREERREFLLRTLEACAFVIRHTLVAALFILCFGLLHRLVRWAGEPKMFGSIPVAYIFDAIDLVVLGVFLVTGTFEAIRVFEDEKK